MARGIVVRFDEAKGYGFIAPDDGGDDVFVHANELSDRGASVVTGTQVEFGVLDGGRGLKAYDVRVVGAAKPTTEAAPGGPLPSGALDRSAGAQPAARNEPLAEGTCEIFSPEEFTRLATEVLLASDPDLTVKQVLTVRAALVSFATQHGWVD